MKKSDGALGVGVITISTVLLVLCLSVMAMLAFSSARAELHLAQANAENISAYYAADMQAHRLYADFAAASEESLRAEISISDRQSLCLWLEREDGQVRVRAWNTVTREAEAPTGPELWDGNLSEFGGQKP